MTKFIAAFIVAMLTFPDSVVAITPVKECLFLSEQDFYYAAETVHTTVYYADAKALDVILKSVNEIRALKRMWPLEADKMIVGLYKWKHKDGSGIGEVMVKDGCIVPGSARQEEEIDFLLRIGELGLSMDNFTPRG